MQILLATRNNGGEEYLSYILISVSSLKRNVILLSACIITERLERKWNKIGTS